MTDFRFRTIHGPLQGHRALAEQRDTLFLRIPGA